MSQQSTIDLETKAKGPVTCLGQVFTSEDARREHYRNLLREKLKDPEFRQIEGFPIGKDEDIIALSDPPYYTACPNPWINDFIAEWEKEKGARPDEYHREPFAADVSEGKNDPIYNAHSYHTKVPHKAIMRYILHYTDPGDIVFDGFCGTGMTGVAAQLCGDRKVVESLGYQVKDDGTILDEEGKPFSKLGARKAILNDLSPAATFIAANYNSPVDLAEFEREANRILEEVEDECGWMYETLHTDGMTPGKINYTVWSDVFICPNCSQEVVFWDVAVDRDVGEVKESFVCSNCNATLTKRLMERSYGTIYDTNISANISEQFHSGDGTISQIKQVPVLINYTFGGKRFNKAPDESDRSLISLINQYKSNEWFPYDRMPEGDESRRNDAYGFTHIHHFYTRRNLIALSCMKKNVKSHRMLFALTGLLNRATRLN